MGAEPRGFTGGYETCPNGCRYCYANRDHKKAAENYRLHDPESPLLIGHLRPEDTVTQGVQKSLLAKGGPADARAVAGGSSGARFFEPQHLIRESAIIYPLGVGKTLGKPGRKPAYTR